MILGKPELKESWTIREGVGAATEKKSRDTQNTEIKKNQRLNL